MIGKSLAYPGANCFSGAVPFGEMLVAINPICAEIVGQEMPEIEDVQECLWQLCERAGRFTSSAAPRAAGGTGSRPQRRPNLSDARAQGHAGVRRAAGLGGLHATALPQLRHLACADPADRLPHQCSRSPRGTVDLRVLVDAIADAAGARETSARPAVFPNRKSPACGLAGTHGRAVRRCGSSHGDARSCTTLRRRHVAAYAFVNMSVSRVLKKYFNPLLMPGHGGPGEIMRIPRA